MGKRLLLAFVLVVFLSLVAFSDGKIAIVLDVGGRGDLSFNDMGFVGADRAATEFGLEVTEVQSASAADYLPNFRNLARTGDYELILGVGFLLGDALGTAAAEYPDQKFAIIDVGWIQAPNIMNFVFRENEMSALIGALAGMAAADAGFAATGIVLGIPIPVLYHFEAGYRFGQDWGLTRYTELTGNAAEVALLYTYTGTFDDIALGKAASEAMLAQGAVGIYNVAGPLGTGDHEAVVEFHDNAGTIYGAPFYFGVDANQDWFGQGFHALASGMKRVDQAAYAAVEAVMTDAFVPGVTSLGLAEGGVGISDIDLLIEFIEFGVNAGAVEDTQSARNYIVANWTANRATVASWIWDAIDELEVGILDGSIIVPTADNDTEIQALRRGFADRFTMSAHASTHTISRSATTQEVSFVFTVRNIKKFGSVAPRLSASATGCTTRIVDSNGNQISGVRLKEEESAEITVIVTFPANKAGMIPVILTGKEFSEEHKAKTTVTVQ